MYKVDIFLPCSYLEKMVLHSGPFFSKTKLGVKLHLFSKLDILFQATIDLKVSKDKQSLSHDDL